MRLKAILITILLLPISVGADEVVEVRAREGATQSFLWMPHATPVATVISLMRP